MTRSIFLLAAAAPALTLAQMSMDVDVGMGGLKFSPDSLSNVAMGTKVNFHFYNPGNHSVAQSTFQTPCMPAGSSAIFSGFSFGEGMPESNMMFTITVTSSDPIWLYCSQADHCQAGMAMVINPPSGDTISAYKTAAQMTSENISPQMVGGGVVAANVESGSGSMATGTSSGMSMMTTSSMMDMGTSSMMAMGSSSMMPTGTSSMAMGTSSMAMASSSMGMAGSSMPGSSGTSSAMAAAVTSGAAMKNSQAKGAVGAAAIGLLGALLA